MRIQLGNEDGVRNEADLQCSEGETLFSGSEDKFDSKLEAKNRKRNRINDRGEIQVLMMPMVVPFLHPDGNIYPLSGNQLGVYLQFSMLTWKWMGLWT